MATTNTNTYSKVNTTFVYKGLGHVTNNTVTTAITDVTNLSVKPVTPISYDVPNRVLNLAEQSITAEYLQRNLDMSNAGFNAAMVSGCRVNNSEVSSHAIWTSERILQYFAAQVNIIENNLLGANFICAPEELNTFFTVEHNLNSNNLNYSLVVEQDDGTWKNDLCDITFIDSNTLTIELSEPSRIRLVVNSVQGISCDN